MPPAAALVAKVVSVAEVLVCAAAKPHDAMIANEAVINEDFINFSPRDSSSGITICTRLASRLGEPARPVRSRTSGVFFDGCRRRTRLHQAFQSLWSRRENTRGFSA